jgi:hypothetical protein
MFDELSTDNFFYLGGIDDEIQEEYNNELENIEEIEGTEEEYYDELLDYYDSYYDDYNDY